MKTDLDKKVALFKRCVQKVRTNKLLTEIGVDWVGQHAVWQDDRGNTHAIKLLHIKDTGNVELWYAGANKSTHLIQRPIKSVPQFIKYLTKVYSQENNE